MTWLITLPMAAVITFFLLRLRDIHKAENKLIEMEILEMKLEMEQIDIEKTLIALEPEEYRESIWREFQFEHAMGRMIANIGVVHKGRTTEQIMTMGRLMAKSSIKEETK